MRDKKLPVPGLEECIAASGGTQALLAGDGVYGEIPRLLRKEYAAERVFLIGDENTMQAAGNGVERLLMTAGIPVAGKLVFQEKGWLHADYAHTALVKDRISAAGPPVVPLSVGSGTINDLVKLAAGELGLPYICVPTAASVDGFTSFGAAILKDGFKQTMPCAAPRCVVADTTVLAQAPAWLSSSGFADLAGKITAGADWIIAESVEPFGAKGAEAREPQSWAMVQNGLYGYLEQSIGAAEGSGNALKALFEALSITGFAMQYSKSSRPVSGAEHLFAHIWEMENLSHNGLPVTHGHKVAIGTLVSTAFLEILFSGADGPPPPPPSFKRPSLEECLAETAAAFANSPALDSAVKTSAEKYHDAAAAAEITSGIHDTWKELREKTLEQIMPYAGLRSMLARARCPVLPAQINLSREAVIACARRARMIRNRYICLDLAWDLGCFDTVLARMEESEVYLR
ncbi:MAG: sn-glycerol-1-phosphate dehydrogenase [Treponema sp.]|jgi:glycerol-1-phosphate dehydrogenase [NAD(P)+]|nr:sn-glycerol-1-phosphate dehydrogenase [Treponema sp.]